MTPRRTVPALVVLVLAAVACSSSGPRRSAAPGSTTTGTAGAPPSTGQAAATTTSTGPAAGRSGIGHVFVVNLENSDYESTWGASSPATYLNGTLRPQGELLTQYYAIGHASLDNYIAEISGQAPNPQTQGDCPTFTEFVATGTGAYGQALGAGCVYPRDVLTVGDQLEAAGRTWKAYEEDIGNSATEPKTCRHPPIGGADPTLAATATDMYATRHDPFVYFHSVIDDPSCSTRVIGLDALAADLARAATTPNLSFITPNVCDDGHDSPCRDGRPGGLVSADAFLRTWVPRILASPAYRADGMLVITVDEAEAGGGGDSSGCCSTPPSPNSPRPGVDGPGGGRVGALVLSVRTVPGSTDGVPYNHYALLRSIENVFGLSHLGFAGAPGLRGFGADVFGRRR